MNDDSEYCRIMVYDTQDLDLVDGTIQGNYYAIALFSGGPTGFCDPEWNAAETCWWATHTGTADIRATLYDQDNDERTNDPDDVVLVLGVDGPPADFCAGFTVRVELNVNGAFAIGPVTIEEHDAPYVGYGSTAFTAWVTARNAQLEVTANNYIHIQLDFKSVPSDAVPRRNIETAVRWRPAATWEWEVSDDDSWDAGGDRVGFTVGLSYYFGAAFAYNWEVTDDEEGLIAGDWSYASDGVGGNRNPGGGDPLWLDESGKYWEYELPHAGSGTRNQNQMESNTGAGYLSRQRGQRSDSAYTISLNLKAVGSSFWDFAGGRTKWDESAFHVDEVRYAPW